MNELFLKILNLSVSASWLILAVLAFRILLKKAPKWVNVLLWGIVAVRLICPFSIESAFSLVPSAEVISPTVLLETPEIHTGIPAVDAAIDPWIQGAAVTVAPEKSISTVKLLIRILAGIWAVGAALLLAYTGVSYWRLRRRVDTAVLWKDSVYQSENVDAPFVLGVFRPRIYLPFGMEEQKLFHVVSHEKAHIQRKDHWWKPLGFLLLTVHWMNPLMWVAYVLLCRDIELACDEKVIKKLGSQQRADYTQALVACSINRRRIAACPLAFGEVGVKERVRSVMNYKKPAFWIILLAVIGCAVIAVCFLTNPVTGVRNPWVREYVPGAEGIRGSVDTEKYENISEDFAIGADQYGRAVFKDPHKAFSTLRELYGAGIKAIQKEFGLPPLSRATAGLYKTYGWQTAAGSSEASFVSGFLDIYENSFTKEVPPEEAAPATRPGPAVTKWFDGLETPEDMLWDETLERTVPEYPDVTFRWNYVEMEAVTAEGAVSLYSGMPIWSVYFCDLTGDGFPEICSTVSFGSGMIDNRVTVYDYAKGTGYELSDRGFHDFALRLNESDGMLYVDKRIYPDGKLVSSGPLVLGKDGIQMGYDRGNAEAAITRAILDRCRAEKSEIEDAIAQTELERNSIVGRDGLLHVESHVLLASESSGKVYLTDGTDRMGRPVDGKYAMDRAVFYLLVRHVKYSTYGGNLEEKGGSFVPAVLTFGISESGEYILEEYWEPRDGSFYAKDIRDRFPEDAADAALDHGAYVEELKDQIYRKALAYLESTGGLDMRIGELLDRVCAATGGAAGMTEYQELLDYGEYTLRSCFGEFLEGGRTDPRGQIMAQLCRDILRNWGEGYPADFEPESGQAWFEEFRGNAERLAAQISREELEKHYPGASVLLRMLGGEYTVKDR